MITGAQVRGARGILKLDQRALAEKASVSVETIKRLEKIDGPLLTATGTTLHAIQTALESVGIEFIEGGVRKRNVE
ncbi:transcriptional regulator [Shinella yambaruensis]|uniref:transcriptional regulator n=1 Tax=Shinella yambaruensis TaxID=415996 RepID=UPI003D7B1B5A